ncbi:hypothetical protein D3C72_392280 [compost metagenome]
MSIKFVRADFGFRRVDFGFGKDANKNPLLRKGFCYCLWFGFVCLRARIGNPRHIIIFFSFNSLSVFKTISRFFFDVIHVGSLLPIITVALQAFYSTFRCWKIGCNSRIHNI